MADIQELDRMFSPKSMAVVGASPNPKGWGATHFLQRLISLGFPGNLYPINPKAQEVLGLRAFPKVSAIPETVDLVMVGISAPGVPSVLEDCVAAGVKNVHIFRTGEGLRRLIALPEPRVFRGIPATGPGPGLAGAAFACSASQAPAQCQITLRPDAYHSSRYGA